MLSATSKRMIKDHFIANNLKPDTLELNKKEKAILRKKEILVEADTDY